MTDDGAIGTGGASHTVTGAPTISPSEPPGPGASDPRAGGPVRANVPNRRGSWFPTWPLIATKHLELRRRRGLMFVVLLLTVGLPFIVLGIRLLFHAVDPKSYGPAGSPSVFEGLCLPMAEFGFIIAAALGATAGTTDLTEGVFRHLVVTGRSRLALYLARIPSGLSILLPLVGVAFASLCLVTAYEGTAQPTSVNENGISVPVHLDEAQLKSWLLQHPGKAEQAFENGPIIVSPKGSGASPAQVGPPGPTVPRTPAAFRSMIDRNMTTIYGNYTSDQLGDVNPPVNEMVKIGLWLELEVLIGFMVGLGLGSLMGQRTVSTILMVVFEIIDSDMIYPITAYDVPRRYRS